MSHVPYLIASCHTCESNTSQARGLKRTEEILYDVFPKHVADALKQVTRVCCRVLQGVAGCCRVLQG